MNERDRNVKKMHLNNKKTAIVMYRPSVFYSGLKCINVIALFTKY